MNCLKCGIEISGEQVFCDSCLADMERHPVKPGTPVNIPMRSKPLPVKRTHRKIQKPEELIAAQRRLIGWLLAFIMLLLVGIGVIAYAMFYYKDQAESVGRQLPALTENVSRETFFNNF